MGAEAFKAAALAVLPLSGCRIAAPGSPRAPTGLDAVARRAVASRGGHPTSEQRRRTVGTPSSAATRLPDAGRKCASQQAVQIGRRSWLRDTATSYFDTQRRGTNFFNAVESRARFRAAAALGIRLVLLVPDKWNGAGRDFLMGSADGFRNLVPEDLARLRLVLDAAHAERVKVVLGLLSLPGARWRQLNGNRSDFRLYREVRYQDQAVELWRQLAAALRGHPAVVAYNPINEPHPERSKNTASFDLTAFYRRVVAAIREADRTVAVVLDGGDFASPQGLARLGPIDDPRVLYAFHMYEPWPYINHASRGRYRYPGEIPVADDESWTRHWDARALEHALSPVVVWQRKHRVPANRIFAAEFGCPRTHPGVERWLGDLIRIFNARGWHWAFYSFREDTWHAMDYERGPEPDSALRKTNRIWRVIGAAFR